MPKFALEETIRIAAPAAQIYPFVRNLREWVNWSPWVLAEPDCKIEYSDDGKSYAWDGAIIGSGRITIVEAVENERIDFKLEFIKPWKSESKTSFYFDERNGETDTRWGMESSLPFFLFWMKKMMVVMVGRDYARGLLMLKDLVELEEVPSKLEFKGLTDIPATRYLGFSRECLLSEIEKFLPEDLEQLGIKTSQLGALVKGKPMSLYHKYQMVKGRVAYSVAVPVDDSVSEAPEGLELGTIQRSKAYSILHTGAYRHLQNAWAAGMMHSRSKVFKSGKQFPPFESYVSDPTKVSEKDIVTEIVFPAQ